MNQTTNPGFSEEDFTALASALDGTRPEQRELFLVKLVVLLSAPTAGALRGSIGRALQHMPRAE